MEKFEISPLIEFGNVNSVRNAAIQLLGQEWPLNVRKMHSRISEKKPGISYHAVHKAVQQLVKEKVLRREEAGYLIDSNWVEQSLALLKGMKTRKSGIPLSLPRFGDFKEGDTKTLTLNTLADVDKYLMQLKSEYSSTQSRIPYIAIARHLRSVLVYSEKIHAPTVIYNAKSYYLIAGKTAIDEWCVDYWRVRGAYAHTGVDASKNCDTRVLGDLIIQTYTPEDLEKRLDAVFSSVRDISDFDVPSFYQNIYTKFFPIKFVIMKNHELAEQIRNQALSRFNISKIAVIDLDGTFIPSAFPLMAASWLASKGVINDNGEIAKLCERYISGKVSDRTMMPEFLRLYSKAIRGISPGEICKSLAGFVETDGRKFVSQNTFRIFHTVRSYRKLLVITRMPLEFAETLGLNSDVTLASTYEAADGKFTGKSIRNMSAVNAVESAFESYIAENKNIDMDGSIGIGNRYNDLSFLDKLKHPFIMNPDLKLALVAKRKGWPTFNSVDGIMPKIYEVLK